MEFDIFFSMMAHENIEFLEFQFQNLRSSFKDKKVLIIIHFNNIFWSELSKELSQLCLKYTDNQIVIKINPNHFKTEWGSSSGFDGLVSNLQLGHEYGHTFRYFLFYSSSELFIKSGLIKCVNEYLLSKNISCHCLTIPKYSLFKIIIFKDKFS